MSTLDKQKVEIKKSLDDLYKEIVLHFDNGEFDGFVDRVEEEFGERHGEAFKDFVSAVMFIQMRKTFAELVLIHRVETSMPSYLIAFSSMHNLDKDKMKKLLGEFE